jgi:hypothetical protein
MQVVRPGRLCGVRPIREGLELNSSNSSPLSARLSLYKRNRDIHKAKATLWDNVIQPLTTGVIGGRTGHMCGLSLP